MPRLIIPKEVYDLGSNFGICYGASFQELGGRVESSHFEFGHANLVIENDESLPQAYRHAIVVCVDERDRVTELPLIYCDWVQCACKVRDGNEERRIYGLCSILKSRILRRMEMLGDCSRDLWMRARMDAGKYYRRCDYAVRDQVGDGLVLLDYLAVSIHRYSLRCTRRRRSVVVSSLIWILSNEGAQVMETFEQNLVRVNRTRRRALPEGTQR